MGGYFNAYTSFERTVYWIDIMAELWQPAASIRWISPFNYYDPIRSAVIPYTPVRNVAVLVGFFVVATALAAYRFNRRDL